MASTVEVIGACRQGAVLSTSINSPTVQPPRNNARRFAVTLRSTVLWIPYAWSPCCRLLLSVTQHMWIKGLWKLGVEVKGIPLSATPRNLNIYGLWDVNKGNWTQSQYCHFSKSHNRRDNLNMFDDIQISSMCYHFTQHSKHYRVCQADYIAWQTFISWMTLNMK